MITSNTLNRVNKPSRCGRRINNYFFFLLLGSYDREKDFSENIGKYATYDEGITAEELARKLRVSPLIARIKLHVKLFTLSVAY